MRRRRSRRGCWIRRGTLRLIRFNVILVVRSPLPTSFTTPPLPSFHSIPFHPPLSLCSITHSTFHSSYTDAATAADKLFLPTFDNAQKADSLRATIAFVERSKILFRAPTSLKELTQSVSTSSSFSYLRSLGGWRPHSISTASLSVFVWTWMCMYSLLTT
jgi:hypothetical protein